MRLGRAYSVKRERLPGSEVDRCQVDLGDHVARHGDGLAANLPHFPSRDRFAQDTYRNREFAPSNQVRAHLLGGVVSGRARRQTASCRANWPARRKG